MKKTFVWILLFLGVSSTAFADLKQGALAYSKRDYAAAVKEIKPLAEKGNAAAQYLLGSALTNAKPPVLDLVEAEVWLRKSADQGNIAAMRGLGHLNMLYKKPEDAAQAVQWYRLAADRGDADAQHMLGGMYISGTGIEKNPTQGYMWLLLASERGQLLATVMLDVMHDRFTEQEVVEARRKARDWRPSW